MPPTDPYATFGKSLNAFGRRGLVLTPGATDLDPVPKAVVCLTSGDITVVPVDNLDNETLTFVGVTAGYSPPFRVRRVTAATATVASVKD